MAHEIIWSPCAANDLVEIVEFVARDNPATAQSLADRIMRHADHLTRHPLLGRVYHRTARRTIHELTEPPYRIFYRVDDAMQRVVILTLWHGARREPRL